MQRKTREFALQEYLTRNYGLNLKKIDPDLNLIESEHKFKGGRIDILAKKRDTLVGLELKSREYQTRGICAQLLNYLNYLSSVNGEIYFIAPKIKYGIYSTLKNFYESGKLKLFEYTQIDDNIIFNEVFPSNLDDSREITYKQDESAEFITKEKLKKGLSIIIKDDKKVKFINSLLDDDKSNQKQLENITSSFIDIIPSKKYSVLKTIYELFKLI